MSTASITKDSLAALIADLVASNARVVAPKSYGSGVAYQEINKADEIAASNFMPARSLKELFLPPTETLLRFKQKKGDMEIESASAPDRPTIVIGARPCDAAGVDVLDRVMNWDYRDTSWFSRREATTIISFACAGVDKSCFCTSVGLAPDTARGTDIVMVPAGDGYHVEVLTDKGKKLVETHAERFGGEDRSASASTFREEARKKVAANLDASPKTLENWLRSNFNEAYWNAIALRCHGCGACASVCPTCHCFDIVDECEGIGCGARRRNWDTCQTARFTVHSSGHNPRADQNTRIRQRVMHKFYIYPDRFGEVLCTGSRPMLARLPGGMDLQEILADISAKATASGGAA